MHMGYRLCGFRHQALYVEKNKDKTDGSEEDTAEDIKAKIKAIDDEIRAIEKVCHRLPRTSGKSFTSITFYALPAASQGTSAAKGETTGSVAGVNGEIKTSKARSRPSKQVCHRLQHLVLLHPLNLTPTLHLIT